MGRYWFIGILIEELGRYFLSLSEVTGRGVSWIINRIDEIKDIANLAKTNLDEAIKRFLKEIRFLQGLHEIYGIICSIEFLLNALARGLEDLIRELRIQGLIDAHTACISIAREVYNIRDRLRSILQIDLGRILTERKEEFLPFITSLADISKMQHALMDFVRDLKRFGNLLWIVGRRM